MDLKKCKHCGKPIAPDAHGNREYCDYNCYFSAKKKSNKTKYKDFIRNNQVQRSDNHLGYLHKVFGDDHIPVQMLNKPFFLWNGMTQVKNGKHTVYCFNKFGFILFENNTFVICKI